MRNNRLRLLVFISGSGSNLQAIVDNIADEKLDATIDMVISSHSEAFGLQRAAKADIAHTVVSPKEFVSKQEYEQALLEILAKRSFDLLILAGYMYVLSAHFIAQYPTNILNIHPSLLPKYKGLHTHRRVLEAGEKQHGATVHFVTAELDNGPIVLQDTVSIEADDDEASLQQKVLQREHVIYSQAIQHIADGAINYHDLAAQN